MPPRSPSTLAGLFGARLLLGVGEAPTFPANAKAIGDWFPRAGAQLCSTSSERCGGQAGIGHRSALARDCFCCALAGDGASPPPASISLLYLLLFWAVYREPEEDTELSDAERHLIDGETRKTRRPRPTALHSRSVRCCGSRKVIGLSLGFGSYNYVFYLLLTWLPSYLSEALHIDLMHSFLYTGVPWLFATVTDLFLGGMLVDALVSRGWNAELVRRIVLVAGTACGLGILGAAHAHSAAQALAWISSIDRRTLCCCARGLVGSRSDHAARQRRQGGRHRELRLPGFGHHGADPYRLHRQEQRTPMRWPLVFRRAYLLLGIAGYLFLLGNIEPMKMKTAHFPAA